METRLELDVLIFPEEVRIATPEDLTEWELETASQLSRPTVRLFVALYPYNPAAMSPNYETAAEELPFVPGQIIKVTTMLSFFFPFAQHNIKAVQVKLCFFMLVYMCVVFPAPISCLCSIQCSRVYRFSLFPVTISS